MYDAVLLTLDDAPDAAGCGCGDEACAAAPAGAVRVTTRPRAAVLACRDALGAGGLRVHTVTAGCDADIDAVLDGLPAARLVVAVATDGQVRAVLRRMVRRYAPPPGKRPPDLPADRTVPDLPAIGVLPLDPAGSGDLAARLGLPRHADDVAAAVLAGRSRRFDLLRTDAGSVTLDGALVGATGDRGRAVPFAARVEVDDAVLSDGGEPLLATAICNADGYALLDGLPMAVGADPADGLLEVAVALEVTGRDRLGRRRMRFEVRRARGRAVAVVPRADVPYLDDGVAGSLTRKRTWWMERAVWAAYG